MAPCICAHWGRPVGKHFCRSCGGPHKQEASPASSVSLCPFWAACGSAASRWRNMVDPPLHALWEDVKKTGSDRSAWCPVPVQEAEWPVQGPVTLSWVLVSHNVCGGTDPDLKWSCLRRIPNRCLLGTTWIFGWFILKAKIKQAGGDFNSQNDVGHFFPWPLARQHVTAVREHL